MNNQNRPKANYHLLATVATLGPFFYQGLSRP